MIILGASFLFRALNSQEYQKKRRLRSLRRKSISHHKRPQLSSKDTKSEKVNLHEYQRGGTNRRVCYLARRNTINNSLSPHFNNFDSPLTGPELADSLKTVSSRIRSIIYCQRTETSNIYRDLKNAGLPVVDVVKIIASRKGDISEALKQL